MSEETRIVSRKPSALKDLHNAISLPSIVQDQFYRQQPSILRLLRVSLPGALVRTDTASSLQLQSIKQEICPVSIPES